jgi:major vault protein
VAIENRQKIPVPRRSFLWSLNETSGEILTHIGPTEFTPSANDRIVKANDRAGFESASMEARPFVVARDGEYVLLQNPIRGELLDDAPNGNYVPGGNKEKELVLGTTKVVPGPCAFPLWPGQSAEVRPAHKLGANHYLLVEVVGPLDEKARYYRLVIESAGLSSAVIDAGVAEPRADAPRVRAEEQPAQLRLGQRIVIQGRHTQLFIPPSGIEIVPPIEEDPTPGAKDNDDDGVATLPPNVQQECVKLVAQVREGVSAKQFSILKNELRHRQELSIGERAIVLAALDAVYEERAATRRPRGDRGERRQSPADPYARRAVVLGPKEFCILFDADGNPRIVRGPARVFPGPHDTFLQRGSRRRVYDAYELAEHQALWLRIIAPISRASLERHLPPGFPLERESYDAGHEFIVRGLPSVFFPFIEAEVIHPQTREPHVGNDHDSVVFSAVGIDQKSGIYVRDLRTGMVKMVRGETSHLVDPRFEEHVVRRVPREQWNLTIGHAERHKVTTDEVVATPWAISVTVPNNEACLITSRHGRRVEIGPKVVLLEYEEQLTPLTLSKGPSKDGHTTVTSCFLRVQGGRVADTFEIASADFVRLRIRLGFAGHFEGEPEGWFQVEDPVKLLADTVRAKVREGAHAAAATRILRELPEMVRAALFTQSDSLRFPQNGMVVDHVTVLAVQVVEPELAQMFAGVQRESLKFELQDQQATRRLESLRHQDAVDEQEHVVVRAAVGRKGESRVYDAEIDHRVAVRQLELKGLADRASADLKHALDALALEHEGRADRARAATRAESRTREAEGEARAQELVSKVIEVHRAAMAQIDQGSARAVAEADAVRLAAIQRELVGALHAAADSEVMKAAANNMNLVSLLGGKSPAELLQQIVRGTPLERTTDGMRERAPRSAMGDPQMGGEEDPRD